jgi:hypothetical protein
MRTIGTIVAAAILLFVFYVVLSVIVAYFGGDIWALPVHHSWALPDSWSEWRDIVIVFSAGFFVIAGILLVVLLGALVWLVVEIRHLLKTNVAPAVDSLKGTLDNVRGTTEFAGETIASPMIRAYSIVRGVRSGVSAVRNFPANVRGRRKKKKRGLFR